ncbi:SGNH/GDSL hydrolase family protein [Rhodoblastus sp. 17X3]|uniref:SGNH/GDSL hydrolase family protein n=1 Tax=Rhodoblastus sp. 17X3 TaxID=3047026 RepID=UPI0024B6D039|nr:SGNH/GDSL hydrolase family protein [Rhodoblastus sp. 17X3]MDI9848569.1 SGNH/GDSL hydrolase family protein [Rhodoblastus sp. 17X3]
MSIQTKSGSLVVFGDSLSDNGNLFSLTNGGYPPPPAWQGRGSNGPTYAEQLAPLLGLSLNDFAYYGGQASDNSPPVIANPVTGARLPIDLSNQIKSYLSSLSGGQIPSNATVMINIGSDDYLGYLETNPPQTPAAVQAMVSDVVGAVGQAVAELTQAGAKKILLFALPDIAITPAGVMANSPAFQALVHAIDVANNTALAQIAAASPNVKLVDLFALSDALAADPTSFGFTAPITTTWSGQLASGSQQFASNEIAFFDALHPTYVAHGIIAAFADAVIASDHVDFLDGTQRVVHAQSGSTFIFAKALDPGNTTLNGNDTIYGGVGDDTIIAGSGNVTVWGGVGNDLIAAGSGNAALHGGLGTDVIATNSLGVNALTAGIGDDALIVNRGGTNSLRGGAGSDLFILKEGDGLVNADGTFSFGQQHISGGIGDDTLRIVINDQNPVDEKGFIAEFLKIESAFDQAAKTNHPGSFQVDGLTVSGIDRLELQVSSASTDPNTPYLITSNILLADGAGSHVSSGLSNMLSEAGRWGLLTV